MDDLIPIAYLNDFVFCPASIYFHGLYGNRTPFLYQKRPQLDGLKAHETVDSGACAAGKKMLAGMDVYSEKYGLIGKIDIYDCQQKALTERKKKIKTIYDGYVFQLYGQYFCMKEMGYAIDSLWLYSMEDNKKYGIKLPAADPKMFEAFEKTVEKLRTTGIENFVQTNKEKCTNCIYFDACDRGAV